MIRSGVVTGLHVLIACVAIAAAGCTTKQVTDDDVPQVTETEVDAMIGDSDVVLVDVRNAQAYAGGHLPGAINIFAPELRPADLRLGEGKRIVVYASGYTDPLSVAAAKRLIAYDYAEVYEFKGGTSIWEDSGRQLVKSAPPSDDRRETGR